MSHSPKLQYALSNVTKLMIFSVILLVFSNVTLATEQNVQEAWQKIEAGALVVDVRTAEEFAGGHLPNAINVPFEQITTVFANKNIATDQDIVLYCRSGRRSGIANDALISAGYTNTYNAGGYSVLIQH